MPEFDLSSGFLDVPSRPRRVHTLRLPPETKPQRQRQAKPTPPQIDLSAGLEDEPPAKRRQRGLDPDFETQINDIISSVSSRGLKARLSEGYRSPEQQDEYYSQGRTKPGRIVTYARGTQGPHTRGTAADIDLLDDKGRPLADNDPAWKVLGEEAERRGLTWGGAWSKLRDSRHVEQQQRAQPKPTPKVDDLLSGLEPDDDLRSGLLDDDQIVAPGQRPRRVQPPIPSQQATTQPKATRTTPSIPKRRFRPPVFGGAPNPPRRNSKRSVWALPTTKRAPRAVHNGREPLRAFPQRTSWST